MILLKVIYFVGIRWYQLDIQNHLTCKTKKNFTSWNKGWNSCELETAKLDAPHSLPELFSACRFLDVYLYLYLFCDDCWCRMPIDPYLLGGAGLVR